MAERARSMLPDAAERAAGRAPLALLLFLGLMTSVVALTILLAVPIGIAIARGHDGWLVPLFAGFLALGCIGMALPLLADRPHAVGAGVGAAE